MCVCRRVFVCVCEREKDRKRRRENVNNELSPAEKDHIWYYFNLEGTECECGCVKLLRLEMRKEENICQN